MLWSLLISIVFIGIVVLSLFVMRINNRWSFRNLHFRNLSRRRLDVKNKILDILRFYQIRYGRNNVNGNNLQLVPKETNNDHMVILSKNLII